MSTNIKGIRSCYNLGRMLPLGSPGEAEAQVLRILWRAPLFERAKGPSRRVHPHGVMTRIVANSFNIV